MPTILSGLDIALRALNAQQLGLEITQRNVANASTPGYTKLRVSFEPATGSGMDSTQAVAGIEAATVDSFRNSFVEYNISQELQGQGEQQAAFDAVQQVEALFTDKSGRGLQSALSDFFNSFSSLSNAPEDPALRQQVLLKAGGLTQEFGRLYDRLKRVQLQQNQIVYDTVEEINSIASKIARMNTDIFSVQGSQTGDESAALDDRQRLLDHLSELVDISYFEDSSGTVTVETKQGALLVAGAQSKALEIAPSPQTGFYDVMQDGVDITSTIQSGKLAGALKVRDTTIPAYLKSLDDMAAALITDVNLQHASGSDLNGDQGGDFFTPFAQPAPGSNAGAARSISVAIADPKLIAAAGQGKGPGSNSNAQLLAGMKDEALPSLGDTADQFYANLILRVGLDSQSAADGLQTQKNLVQQLQNQRDSFSGVSLDEEAVNIIKYQKAYQASARFVTVLNILSDDILRILGG
jgi:flagellar hook-associated protein 1 FlgK